MRRKKVIVPEGLGEELPAKVPEPLAMALARAFHWQELLDSGKYSSITELAVALVVDRKYVSRILNLACLAPDIVEAIVAGQEPSGLSLERLATGDGFESRAPGWPGPALRCKLLTRR